MTVEELAAQLAEDQEFSSLPQAEQNSVFAELAADIQSPPSATVSSPQPSRPSIFRQAALQAMIPPLGVVREAIGGPGTIPQWVLNLGLPSVGGVLAGIPGMAGGSMLAKGMETTRNIAAGQRPSVPTVLKDIAMAGVGSAVIGKGFQAATGGLHALRVARNVPLRAGFLRSVRQSFFQSKKLVGETFGKQLDDLAAAHPKQTVDLSIELARVQERTLNNPAFKAMLNRATMNSKESALVQSLINQPSVGQSLTMKEAQTLKQVVSRMLKQKFEQISPDLTDAHLDANDFYHGIRLAQLKAFPDFADIAESYHTALTNFRTVKPYLTKAALEPALLNRFGNRAEIQEAVRELLPKETVREITRFVKAMYFPQRARRTLGWGTAGLTVAEIIRRIGRSSSPSIYPTR